MGALSDSVRDATGAMSWLRPADEAAVSLALTYAANIDAALETGDEEKITKALFLGPHLLKLLGEIGGTPRGRLLLEVKEDAGGKLAAVRNLRDAKSSKKRKSA